jgi:hypothetical protein
MGWIYRAKTAEYQAGHLAKQYAWLEKNKKYNGRCFKIRATGSRLCYAWCLASCTDGDVGRKAGAHRGAVWGRRRFWREGTEGLLGRLGSADELPVDGLAGGELGQRTAATGSTMAVSCRYPGKHEGEGLGWGDRAYRRDRERARRGRAASILSSCWSRRAPARFFLCWSGVGEGLGPWRCSGRRER